MLKKVIILIIIIFAGSFFYWRNLNSPTDSKAKEQLFTVNKGETIDRIAGNLEKNNLIRSKFYFKYHAWRRASNIQAGQYSISPGLNTQEIIIMLASGNALSREKQIRIIEGWNLKDINNYLNKNKIAPENSFINLAGQKIRTSDLELKTGPLDEELASGLPDAATWEGFLFPDTYRINKDGSVQEIMRKMLANFNKKMTPELRQEIKRQDKTVYEIITMSSLIEKEVRTAADMKIVSGIFWDRIKNGQALESCATLAYILGINKAQYSLKDTRIDSPYNTYRNRGLPPGPIANPGLKAIQAAIYPLFTEYNYFLSDPASGQTIFSRTLSEHNKNKIKYLK